MRVGHVGFTGCRDESHDSSVVFSTEPQSAMPDGVISACQTSSAPQGLWTLIIPGIILPWSHHLPACHFTYLGCRFQYSCGYFVTRRSILYCKWLEDNKYAHSTWCLGALFPLRGVRGWGGGGSGWWGVALVAAHQGLRRWESHSWNQQCGVRGGWCGRGSRHTAGFALHEVCGY